MANLSFDRPLAKTGTLNIYARHLCDRTGWGVSLVRSGPSLRHTTLTGREGPCHIVDCGRAGAGGEWKHEEQVLCTPCIRFSGMSGGSEYVPRPMLASVQGPEDPSGVPKDPYEYISDHELDLIW